MDSSDIEVIVQDNTDNETSQKIREGLERTGKVIKDTGRKAVDGAKNILKSFMNR